MRVGNRRTLGRQACVDPKTIVQPAHGYNIPGDFRLRALFGLGAIPD
jgi:hypothetical protein